MDGKKGVRSERKEATRAQILMAATELLARDGYAALRVAAVAEQAGVSLGGYFHHFPSKEALVIAVLERVAAHVADLARQDVESEGADTDILGRIAQSARRFYSAPEFLIYLDIFLSVRRGTPIGETATALLLRQRAGTEDLWLPHLTERGIAPDEARLIVRALWALARGLAISSLPREAGGADVMTTERVIQGFRKQYPEQLGRR